MLAECVQPASNENVKSEPLRDASSIVEAASPALGTDVHDEHPSSTLLPINEPICSPPVAATCEPSQEESVQNKEDNAANETTTQVPTPPSETTSVAFDTIDVAKIMNSLSDLGQAVAPADNVRVASFIPPRANEPVSSFYNVIDTTHAWGQYPAPADLAKMTRELLQLRTSQCIEDPQMQSLYQAIASTLGSGRHLLPQVQRSKLFDDFGNIADPAVLFEWIMREEVRRKDDMTGKADRSLPLPVYDSNHGFHDSDIVAYTNETLLEDTWGKPQLSTSEDLLARAASPNDTSSRVPPRESVHASGGLTWMERALIDQAPYESLAEYYPYRERMTSAGGKFSAARTRTDIASYPRAGGNEREGFVEAVKHRTATSSSATVTH
ncbi:Hypothetical protein, putative [Bodo saltans]|uniref:Uncharacterized protein n=1 Tax=Bodo saltans TaxID=75058 RepID=A0A0S4J326_BODSA|nr:Hypothetical protein, putative [Bodo saltans]|eukprot:CUG67545.1 Hypothetical protein, putative [Bodo saltans]